MAVKKKAFPVEVVTYHQSDHTNTRSVVIDHNNKSSRGWLSRHIFWAVRNKNLVEVEPMPEGTQITLYCQEPN